MEKLRKTDQDFLKGYARALQDIMQKLTGDNGCAKRYDPIDFTPGMIHSYAFDMKDGGRHHPFCPPKSQLDKSKNTKTSF